MRKKGDRPKRRGADVVCSGQMLGEQAPPAQTTGRVPQQRITQDRGVINALVGGRSLTAWLYICFARLRSLALHDASVYKFQHVHVPFSCNAFKILISRVFSSSQSPVYVSFVSKATLWERGLCRQTVSFFLNVCCFSDAAGLFCTNNTSRKKERDGANIL